jgi:hypothetical protein
VLHNEGEFSMLLDSTKFNQLQRIGKMYAASKMVPTHFQGDEASCMVACQMAMRLNVDPFMFLQKTYVVGGKPGMEAQMAIALVNTRGPFEGPIDWNFKRDDKGKVVEATAFATHKKTGRVCSATVDWAMVEGEGWDKNKKWNSLREQMFSYRSAVFLARRYCPEVLMGMAMADELEEIDITPQPTEGTVEQPKRPTLKERIVGNVIEADRETPSPSTLVHPTAKFVPSTETPSAEELIASGHIVVHDDPVGTGQEAAGGFKLEGGAPTPQPTPEKGAPAAQPSPAMPFESVMRLAKQAKTLDQVDIVRDALRDPGYTLSQREEVEVILKSKKLPE